MLLPGLSQLRSPYRVLALQLPLPALTGLSILVFQEAKPSAPLNHALGTHNHVWESWFLSRLLSPSSIFPTPGRAVSGFSDLYAGAVTDPLSAHRVPFAPGITQKQPPFGVSS